MGLAALIALTLASLAALMAGQRRLSDDLVTRHAVAIYLGGGLGLGLWAGGLAIATVGEAWGIFISGVSLETALIVWMLVAMRRSWATLAQPGRGGRTADGNSATQS